ncbi:hypothetical protein KO493_06935 [Tamlana agarivorans]|uniref:Uncharacterized protein n=1 Tax=Pseudotamlana agarivorans TaxID=481183 RepID=A0ACC5U896_9FLAO|nr:hypothetical protein [Tamlana agarivorans]MBU2950425.1 hypothetical protein [Tamlana agarivorans]
MILSKIKEIENSISRDGGANSEELNAASSVKNLLLQIDYKSEHISDFSLSKIVNLLNFIKEDNLSVAEEAVVKQILEDL